MFKVTTFYRFCGWQPPTVDQHVSKLETLCAQLPIQGLIIIGNEGINGTVAALPEEIDSFKEALRDFEGLEEITFKDSPSTFMPFRRLKIDRREEIVTLDKPEIIPNGKRRHLSPAEWQRTLDNEEVLLLDTRNWYETQLGMFEGAIDPQITKFSEFPEYVSKHPLPKGKKILMYCTGGIRCEKALIEMQSQGYDNVYQLDGGILEYLNQFPDKSFKGECYVFDKRVAVTQHLDPSPQYKLCPHCGDPADKKISCDNCEEQAIICESCSSIAIRNSCSKNCKYHLSRKLGIGRKGCEEGKKAAAAAHTAKELV